MATPVSSKITLVALLKLMANSVGPPVVRKVGGRGKMFPSPFEPAGGERVSTGLAPPMGTNRR